jgi:hypothetical protein
MTLDACQRLSVRCRCDEDCPAERPHCAGVDVVVPELFGPIRYCH